MTNQERHLIGGPGRGEVRRASLLLLLIFPLILASAALADDLRAPHDKADNAGNPRAIRPYRDLYETPIMTRSVSGYETIPRSEKYVPSGKPSAENLKDEAPHSGNGRLGAQNGGGNAGSTRDRLGTQDLTRSKRSEGDQILPDKCPFPPSCKLRRSSPGPMFDAFRYPCKCDDQCHRYGDCCHDVNRTKTTPYSSPMSCLPLQPPSPLTSNRAVFMVTECPPEVADDLAAMCAKTSRYTYLMDIPVVSATTAIVYANVFCAKCHLDTVIEQFPFSVVCSEGNISSSEDLASLTYKPGALLWTTPDDEDSLSLLDRMSRVNQSGRQTHSTSCHLIVDYSESAGRSCEVGLVEECSEDWPQDETRRKCASYNYYVTYNGEEYKNWDCAVCNNAPTDGIMCLSKFRPIVRDGLPRPPPSLTDLFVVDGDCAEDHVWDALFHRCERVSCGYLFTLQDGECVRNNKTIDGGDRSYLNSTCYTTEFRRKYSVMFPNGSVYLNHTEQLYEFNEYEFLNHTWIRVCRPETQWTPAMNIISTVLISISLICMLLHILIFFALPRRQNIPSMNLFSMTCSLFIAELVFVSMFRLNENYTGCVVIAVFMYYFLSASFLWMNVMSIDICRTFHSNRYKIKSKKIFIQYSLYAWSVPLVSTVVAILVDQFASETFVLTPQFGTKNCWFNNKWGLVAFFTFPSGFVVLFNMVLYSVSVYDIYKQHRSGEFASSTVRRNGASEQSKLEKEKEKFLKKAADAEGTPPKDKSSDESDSCRYTDRIKDRIQRRIQANKKQRVRLVLYCKLALIMGTTWIFAFVSIHTQSLLFEYLFIIFNGLQGTFIFIAFDCKQKVWDELKQRFGKGTVLQSKGASSSTRQTSMTLSSEGKYKYRWASNRRQQDNSSRASTIAQGRT